MRRVAPKEVAAPAAGAAAGGAVAARAAGGAVAEAREVATTVGRTLSCSRSAPSPRCSPSRSSRRAPPLCRAEAPARRIRSWPRVASHAAGTRRPAGGVRQCRCHGSRSCHSRSTPMSRRGTCYCPCRRHSNGSRAVRTVPCTQALPTAGRTRPKPTRSLAEALEEAVEGAPAVRAAVAGPMVVVSRRHCRSIRSRASLGCLRRGCLPRSSDCTRREPKPTRTESCRCCRTRCTRRCCTSSPWDREAPHRRWWTARVGVRSKRQAWSRR